MSLKKFFVTFLGILFVFTLMSCGSLGYGVMLWGDAEHSIDDGELVKVYIRSNISHTYVISKVDSSEKFEIPLWKITEPQSKSKAKKQAQKFEEFKGTYASVTLDGLPIRNDAINTSKQVYRLRQNEVIKILYSTTGAAVTNGNGNMDGQWLRVVTSTGTLGWCFSAKLDLYQGDRAGNRLAPSSNLANENSKADSTLDELKNKKWFPEYYSSLVRNNKIDILRMNARYGFDFTSEEFNARAETDEINISFGYDELKKQSDKEYSFEGSPKDYKILVDSANEITLYYTEKGKPRYVKFVALDIDINQVLNAEETRRQGELKKIAQAGPVFTSSNYGTISFANENFCIWKNFKQLVPNIISKDASNNVVVSLKYFISNQLKSTYDGVLTMNFNGMDKEVNFFYKLTDAGLRLEDSVGVTIKDNTVMTRGSSPLIMFFSSK